MGVNPGDLHKKTQFRPKPELCSIETNLTIRLKVFCRHGQICRRDHWKLI
jgi:hypothetical protein